jgi:hypothetical protein
VQKALSQPVNPAWAAGKIAYASRPSVRTSGSGKKIQPCPPEWSICKQHPAGYTPAGCIETDFYCTKVKGGNMPVNRESRNNSSPQRKGNPSDTGQSKAEVKGTPDDEQLKREQEIIDKYGSELDEMQPDVLRGSNPNRNTQKPDIDKPAY